MSNYNTGNLVPSSDPRDLDDNATILDNLMNGTADEYPDRLGAQRKSYKAIEEAADALMTPNVVAFGELVGSADKIPYFTGVEALSLTTLTALARTFNAATDAAGQAAALTWVAPKASPTFTGTPLSTTPAVGTNTTQIATAAMLQAEIANKRAWTTYTPTVTATSGSFTLASANGRYMVAFGVCHIQIAINITTKGTGAYPIVSLPFAALSSSVNYPLFARERNVNNKSGSAFINASLLTLTVTDYAASELATADGAIIYINGSYPVA